MVILFVKKKIVFDIGHFIVISSHYPILFSSPFAQIGGDQECVSTDVLKTRRVDQC